MSSSSPQPGLLVGGVGGDRWELLERLGSGAFGTAWRSYDHELQAVVVVKLLDPSTDPDDVLREASLQYRLNQHPRIVPLRNVELGANPSAFVVTDYVPDGSLEKYLQGRRPTVVETQRWLRDTLEGLAHAHNLGVLHRDIKFSNLLMGSDGHTRLTDFGVADDTARRVEPDMYLPIAPPEYPFEETSVQSDLWLVGVLGWQLLVGRRPDLTAAHRGALPLAHRFSPDVPIALARAVHLALKPDPADRPASAERMLEAVGRVRVVAGWHDDLTSGAREMRAWRADEAGGGVRVSIEQRAQGYRVSARAPAGRRLRQRRDAGVATESAAVQQARAWMLDVVEGRPL